MATGINALLFDMLTLDFFTEALAAPWHCTSLCTATMLRMLVQPPAEIAEQKTHAMLETARLGLKLNRLGGGQAPRQQGVSGPLGLR